MLFTSEYKCDDEACSGEVSFDSFKDWVMHQEWTHQLETGYQNFETAEGLEPIEGFARPCPQCGKKFRSNSEILDHMTRVHQFLLRPFRCDICDERFSTEVYLTAHKVTVHVTKPKPKAVRQFLCVWCGAAFAQKGTFWNTLICSAHCVNFICRWPQYP